MYYAKKLYINNELITEANLTTATKISAFAFENCSGLTNIIIPDSITSIGDSAFSGCSELTSVNCLGTIDQWVEINFGNESSNPLYYAKKLYINNELITKANLTTATKISAYAFFNYSGLTNITIPNGVTSIGSFAFYGCRGLTSVTIPDSVTSIGDSAFHNCSGLTSVNYLGTIDQWAEIDFSSFSSNPLGYARKLYINNELVTEVNLTTATKISAYAFYKCKGLTSITIPDSVTSIGNFAFEGCDSLKYNTKDNINYLGNEGNPYFAVISVTDNLLFSYAIDNSAKIISDSAFKGCKNLISIIIPDSVTSIGAYAFYNCSGLKTVYYKGTAEQWDKISINDGNGCLTNATRYYYSETEPTFNSDGTEYDGNYWRYDTDGVTPVIWKKEN